MSLEITSKTCSKLMDVYRNDDATVAWDIALL